MLQKLNPYNGRSIRATPQVEMRLYTILKVLSQRPRNDEKINIRTFCYGELRKAGCAYPFKEVQEAFEALVASRVCKLDAGSMDRMEIAQFKESAPQAAKKILGIYEERTLTGAERAIAKAKEVLESDKMDSEAKIEFLKLLFKEY